MKGGSAGGPRRALLAAVALVAVAAAGCVGGGGSSSGPPAGGGPGGAGSAQPVTGQAVLADPAGPAPLGLKWDWSRVDRFTPYLERLAGGATFYELVWCAVEPRQGKPSWGAADRVVRSARGLGYSVFLKLRVGSCWATGGRGGFRRGDKGKTASAMPTDLGAYQAWVRAVVLRYAPMGVRQFAIENEVNSPSFWNDTPESYERLATAAADTIRAADRSAVVVDPGISSTAYGVAIADDLVRRGRGADAVAAWQRWYARRFERRARDFPEIDDLPGLQTALGGEQARRNLAFMEIANRLAQRRVVDVRQVHFYERWDNVPALLGYLRSVLPAGFPVQAWEVGMFWPGGSGEPAERADEVVKTSSLLLAGGVRPVIWLPLAFDPGGRHGDEPRYGLLDPGGQPRSAGTAFERLAALARAADSWQGVARPGGTGGVAFDSGRSSTLVLWSERPATVRMERPAGGRAAEVGGTSVPWSASGLQVGPRPLEVTLPGGAGTAGKALAGTDR